MVIFVFSQFQTDFGGGGGGGGGVGVVYVCPSFLCIVLHMPYRQSGFQFIALANLLLWEHL